MALDVYRCKLTWTVNGFPVQSVWYFRNDTANDPAPILKARSLNAAINTWLGPQIVNVMPRNYRGGWFSTRRVNNGGGPSAEKRFLLNGSPASGWASRPGYAPFIKMHFEHLGKRLWHHFTVGGVWDGWFTGQRVVEDQRIELLALTSFLANFSTVTAGAWELVAWHRRSGTACDILALVTGAWQVRQVKLRVHTPYLTRHS